MLEFVLPRENKFVDKEEGVFAVTVISCIVSTTKKTGELLLKFTCQDMMNTKKIHFVNVTAPYGEVFEALGVSKDVKDVTVDMPGKDGIMEKHYTNFEGLSGYIINKPNKSGDIFSNFMTPRQVAKWQEEGGEI